MLFRFELLVSVIMLLISVLKASFSLVQQYGNSLKFIKVLKTKSLCSKWPPTPFIVLLKFLFWGLEIYGTCGRAFAWHAQSPGFHLCHHIKSDAVVQMLSREEEQKFKIILSYIVTLRPAWARWDPLSKKKKALFLMLIEF